MTDPKTPPTFKARAGESDEAAGKRLFEEVLSSSESRHLPNAVPLSRDSPESIQRAALASSALGRELEAIRKQEGDGAALAHASGVVLAACMFVAFDLNRPETAKSTVNYWAERLNRVSGVSGSIGPTLGEA